MSNMSFANNAATTLASSITNSATSLTVQTGAGASFPTLTGSQYFYCTLENGSGSNREIVKVTARATDTFTIVRGQDGTTGTAFNAGEKVELRLVRANLQDFALLDEANTFTQQQTVSAGIKFGDATVMTTAPVASTINGANAQAFTSSGTFTIPTGVTAIKVTIVGGGGGGQSYLGGGTGGTSSIASGTQTISTVSATGGNTNGSGGNGSGGTLNMLGGPGLASNAGQSGGHSIFIYSYGGGGYGGSIPGACCSTSPAAGAGAGGSSIKYLTGLTPGNTLTITVGGGGAGGGNGGTFSTPGGNGYAGLVLIEW